MQYVRRKHREFSCIAPKNAGPTKRMYNSFLIPTYAAKKTKKSYSTSLQENAFRSTWPRFLFGRFVACSAEAMICRNIMMRKIFRGKVILGKMDENARLGYIL